MSESHAGRSGQIRAGQRRRVRVRGWRWTAFATARACLEGAVADGRARGEGGGGGRALQVMHHALVCSKRSSGSSSSSASSSSRQAGRQAAGRQTRQAALAWMDYYRSAV